MSEAQQVGNAASAPDDEDLADLEPMVRRVVRSRVQDPHTVDDLVQETLARVAAARSRSKVDSLPEYASVTARNLVASMATRNIRDRERSHLLVDVREDEAAPEADVLLREERHMVVSALAMLPEADRDLLLAHEVDGQDTATIAAARGSTAGAVAARLFRARANLRVEYLFAAEQIEPPTDRCRPVLRAISAADRRRQEELDASTHLLRCATCARLNGLLGARGAERSEDVGVVRVAVARDADVVLARQKARALAAEAGFSATDMTLVATAISEVTRNIVKFAQHGEIVLRVCSEPRRGIHVVARDVGPGIDDVDEAMRDGFSTCHGFGLGLPGAKRLMDYFELTSTPGEGTTVTMEKWLP